MLLSDYELQEYGLNQHTCSQLECRIELSRRFALAFDDIAMLTDESEGEIILVYTPLNPIEMRQFICICNKIQGKLHRTINGFNDILALYKNSTDKQIQLCLEYTK